MPYFRNMEVHYSIQNSKQFAPILSHLNPIHAIPSCVLRTILMLSSDLSPSLPRGLFFFRPLHWRCMVCTSSPFVPCPTNLLWCNFYPSFPIYCPTWVEIGARDLHMMLSTSPGISWKLAKGRPNSSYRHKWNYIICVPWQYKKCTCTVCV